jgi:hypothetical protein
MEPSFYEYDLLFQTVIDGFDPDKFRQVNKQASSKPSMVSTSSLSNGLATHSYFEQNSSEMDMPGSVPTYDRTEQKLLATLEQELGVL